MGAEKNGNRNLNKGPQKSNQAEFSKRMKERRIFALVLIAAGIILIAAAFFASAWPVVFIRAAMGGLIAARGVDILIPIVKKSKGDNGKAVINMKYLRTKNTKTGVKNIFFQLIGLAIVAVFFRKISDGTGLPFLFSLIYIGLLIPYWVKRIRKNSALRKAVREDSFKIAEAVLYDKKRKKTRNPTENTSAIFTA